MAVSEPVGNVRQRASSRSRRAAWIGTALSVFLSIAIDSADRRNSRFFEDGEGWLYSHLAGGAIIMGTLVAVGILILVPGSADEPGGARWRRAGWGILALVAYVLIMNLLRLSLDVIRR